MIIKLPFKFFSYSAITIWPFIFLLGSEENEVLINHEKIHLKQWKELFLIGFVVLYFVFFIINMVKMKNWDMAYRGIPFEMEAYDREGVDGYLNIRKRMAWVNYL